MSKENSSNDKARVPSHIVLLPDGNRRWAEEKGLLPIQGHLEGYRNLRRFCDWSYKRGVKVLTTFGFSAENWKRPKDEVKYLLELFEKISLREVEGYKQNKETPWLMGNKVRVRIIGQKDRLPLSLQKAIKKIEETTKHNKDLVLNLAVSYSGRWDIIQAIQRLIKEKVSPKKITEAFFSNYLSTGKLPFPDLIIRTGKEKRLSNFLLWQAAYSELYFSEKYWPEFTEKDFETVLEEYAHRQRRFGK